MTADVPELYGSALPKITKEQAIASALSALTRFKRYDQYLVSDAGIALQVPAFFPGPKDLTEELRGIARAKKAIPVYIVRISRGESWSEEKGAYTDLDFVYVDGRDGRSMAIAEMSKFLMGQVSPSEWNGSRI